MKAEDIKRILIIGSGTMGGQIGFYCALHGCDVVLYDLNREILDKAMKRLEKLAKDYTAQWNTPKDLIDQALQRIIPSCSPEEAAIDIDLVNESVPEDPALKAQIFAQFNALCPERTIFTTNTSTLLPSMIAQATGRPERFLAFHFHDILLTGIVDVMPHPGTLPEITEAVRDFSLKIGLDPIEIKKESLGYVFNYMLMGFFHSAQTLAARGVTSVEDIDRAWKGVTRMEMGPFAMMDRIGLDTVWIVTEYWSNKSKDPQSVRNAEFLKQYVERGELGCKSGKGFYEYKKSE